MDDYYKNIIVQIRAKALLDLYKDDSIKFTTLQADKIISIITNILANTNKLSTLQEFFDVFTDKLIECTEQEELN